MFVCLHVFDYFSRLGALAEPKVVLYGRVLDNTLLMHASSAVVFPARASVARGRSSHRLNIMVGAIAATVARDLGSDFSL